MPETTMPNNRTSRRGFLQTGALSALAVGALAACKGEAKASTAHPPQGASQTGGTMGPHDTAATSAASDQMDAMHEKGIKAFPAKTAVWGNQLLQPRIDKGVKVYDLTAKVVQWETEPGKFVTGWAYNGMVPGPQIRVREGERVRVTLKNELPESTSIHFHGLEIPIDQDGVPFITQPPIKPGASYTYEFTVPNAGSHMYHSHHNAAKQVLLGLLGAFIVEPKQPK